VKTGRAATRNAFNTGTGTVQSAVGNYQISGRITSSSTYQDQFQEAVRSFLSASIGSNYIGYVSATGANNTGVYFGGKVALQSGPLRGTNQQSAITGNSPIMVAVYDYFPGVSTGGPIAVAFANSEGTVSGNYARLRFFDDYGSVTMEGQFDGNTFTGAFKYETKDIYNGTDQTLWGTMGDFQIPTCQFFVCQ
jgi:hypothetical protein